MEQLKTNGTRLGEPEVKFIEGKLYEIRMDQHRILFMIRGKELILLHHFLKKTKKTPKSEINKAKREYQDWISRGN